MERGPSRTFADKLEALFQAVHPGRRTPFSNEEVAAEISQGAGEDSISGTYIWQLRKGKRHNPGVKHVEMLARFFGVPPAYFFDDELAKDVDEQLTLLTAMRDAGVRQIALRMNGLAPESLRPIADLIEQFRKLQGLNDETEDEAVVESRKT